MVNLNLQLPDDLKAKAEHRAIESGHDSINDYVEALIRADAEADDPGSPDHLMIQSLDQLEKTLLNRLVGGPSIEVTPQIREDMKRKFRERIDTARRRP